MINVCHFSSLTHWGGVERLILDFLLYSKSDKVRNILFTTSSSEELVNIARKVGILWYQPRRGYRFDPVKLIDMAKQMSLHRVDLVHSYDARASVWAAIASIISGGRDLITSEHGSAWNAHLLIDWLYRWSHKYARLIIANSQASAKLLELKYNFPSSHIRVIYNGVPPIPQADIQKIRTELGIEKDLFVVGSVGRLDTTKDYITLLKAAHIVSRSRRDVVFILVGGGPLESELRSWIDKLELRSSFHITGWRSDARRLIQVFDIFVSTSIHESFGNALIEASLCGKPVIAPSIDGIPEAVINEKTGILIRPTQTPIFPSCPRAEKPPRYVLIDGFLQPPRSLDPEILAAKILDLIFDSELRSHYGKQGKERALNLFSIERYINDLESLYVELANK